MRTDASPAKGDFFVSMPQCTATSPMFTLSPIEKGWIVTVIENGEPVDYLIGVDAKVGHRTGSLTIDEAEVLIALRTFADPRSPARAAFGSLRTLGRRIWGDGYSGEKSVRLLARLGRLKTVAIARRAPGCETAPVFAVLSDWDVAQYQPEGDWQAWDLKEPTLESYRASWVTFSEGFMRWMAQTIDVDATAFFRIRSRLSRAIYLYLPSRAWPPRAYSETKPSRLTLAEILRLFSDNVPEKRADLLRCFERKDATRTFSVVDELNGAALWCGVFRCRLEVVNPHVDPSFCFWIEPTEGLDVGVQTSLPFLDRGASPKKERASGGVLREIWMREGGSVEEWLRRTQRTVSEDDVRGEQSALVEHCGLPADKVERNRGSISLGLRILGTDMMREIRGVIAGKQREAEVDGRKRIKNLSAYWMGCLKDAIVTAARQARRAN